MTDEDPVGRPARGRARRKSSFRPEIGLLVVLGVGAALVSWKVFQQIRIGVPWDTYSFLANAARFAGQSIGFDEPHRPPVMSLLTSLIFRVAPMRVWAIQLVDGVVSFSGLAALYLLLRRRVEQVPATMGALGLLALQPVWFWLGIGYSDLASVALTVWAVLFVIRATEDDARWYVAAFPMAVIASLTRVTALFAVFAMLLWIALRGRPFVQARQMAYGLVAALAAFAPAAVYYADRFGDVLFPYLVYLTMANEQTARGVSGIGIEPGGWSAAPAAIALGLAWLALWGISGLAGRYLSAHRPAARSILLVLAGVAVIGAGQAFGGLVTRQATLPVGVFLVWRALAPRETEGPRRGRVLASSALDATLLLLLLSYADFHGHQPVKVWRYVITVAPALTYLLVVGWRGLADSVGRVSTAAWPHDATGGAGPTRIGRGLTWFLLSAGLAVLLVGEMAGTVSAEPDRLALEAEATAAWIRAREPRPDKLTVYSDVWPVTSWYLGAEARPMPLFPDRRAFAHELSKRRADYYVTLGSARYGPVFETVYTSGTTAVLARVKPDTSARPAIRYLGRAWENYLETVDNFKVDLFYDGGFEGWAGSVFLDAYPNSELQKYAAVAVYRVRWYDRGRAERLLTDYVTAGGTVILDASGNLDGANYPLLDTILFDTVIERSAMPAQADLVPTPAFAARHPGLPARVESTWLDEGGGAWFGATYAPVPGGFSHETLLSLGDTPVVALQRVGRGRVYWISSNLMWHAFKSEDPGERALVQAVLEEAVDRPPVADTVSGQATR